MKHDRRKEYDPGHDMKWEEFFSARDFCRSDFFAKIFIVRTFAPVEEKQSNPKMKLGMKISPTFFIEKRQLMIWR